MHIYFDNSIEILVAALKRLGDKEFPTNGVILRDADGRLSFISNAKSPESEEERETLSAQVSHAIGAYAREDVLIYADDPAARFGLANAVRTSIVIDESAITLIDRRIVGTGWQARPTAGNPKPVRVVFSSLKGGVGRSTALMFAAADLASMGQNVLVVDLDLEAPGLGESLLRLDDMPKFGIVDYLVESNVHGQAPENLDDFIGLSSLTLGRGRVDVLPAFGRTAEEYPANVLPKLSRAMVDVSDELGMYGAKGRQLSNLIDRFTEKQMYDVVLIDSRAGLAEMSAPAVLGLGALVLLFGTAQQQTISGYRALFATLRQMANDDVLAGGKADWRWLLQPVYAKVAPDPATILRHEADLYDLFSENIYDADETSDPSVFRFAEHDAEAPHKSWMIPFESRFVGFDPRRQKDQLATDYYETGFRPFLKRLYDKINVMNGSKSDH